MQGRQGRPYLNGRHNSGFMDLLQVVVHIAGLRLEHIFVRGAQLQLQEVPVIPEQRKQYGFH
jgi:hypothetical protein